MDEAQEIDMDAVVSFKGGKSLIIAGQQERIASQIQSRNLLVSSNRYGYVFYATEDDGLAIISSAYIDEQSRYLTKTTEDDDDDDANHQNKDETPSIFYRPYIPGQQLEKKNSPITPIWIALNADESILGVVLTQADAQCWLIIFYDIVKLIQMSDSTPICPPSRLPSDAIGDTIQNFSWNPAIPNMFAYIDGTGAVSTFEIDLPTKQLKPLGRSTPNNDYSSICWSSKGKQLVVVTYEGALNLYDTNMILKKQYASSTANGTYPPCISVLWLSTYQFLLGYSENSPDENSNESPYFHLLITCDKDQIRQTQIYNDLFFDYDEALPDLNPQYFYLRLNETKIIITGLTKSLKINVLGSNELNQDSLDIWSFADQFRATVKNVSVNNYERPVLTGMALGLNSTLEFREGNKKLPPCPVVYLAHTEGVLQVYYFVHKTLPTICRKAELIKPNPVSSSSTITPTNGFSFSGFGQTPTPPINLNSQPTNVFGLNTQTSTSTSNPSNAFTFNPQVSAPVSSQSNTFSFNSTTTPTLVNSQSNTLPKPQVNDLPKPVQPSTINTITTNQQQQQQQQPSQVDNKKLLQIIDDFQSKLQSVQKSISKPSESTIHIDDLLKTLQDMQKKTQTSIQSVKSMTNEHIESMTKLADASHRIKLSQKENLYHFLRDRELDPWTQSRLDTIKTKYDRIKTNLNVLLQITHTTIHDRSNHHNDDDDNDENNEDFLPALELSINTNETMKQCLQKRIRDLGRQVTQVDQELNHICSKLSSDILSSATFNKTTPTLSNTTTTTTTTANRSFYAFDTDILSYLRANHPKIQQILVPPPTTINMNSTSEPKKSTITEVQKPSTPLLQQQQQPTTPKQTESPIVESEGFKNMLRLVRTSIDLFSGATSPDQLQELSSTIATSPLSSVQKPNVTNFNRTPTVQKSTTITSNKPLQTQTSLPTTNLIQTPAKSVASPVPSISVTPATPANQTLSFNATTLKSQTNKPTLSTATDLNKTQIISASANDSAIRSLLDSAIPTSTSIPSVSTQTSKAVTSGTTSVTSTVTPLVQSPSIATTLTTAVQLTTPATKPIMSTSSTSFGSKPTLATSPFSLTPTPTTNIGFGTATTAPTTSTAAAPSGGLFGSGFGAALSATTVAPTASTTGSSTFGSTTTTTATPTTGIFGTPSTSASSPFGSLTITTATSTAPTSSIFGSAPTISASSPFGSTSATSTAPTTSIFGSAPTISASSPFGSTPASTAPTTSIFGAAPATSTAPTTSIFGSAPATSTASTTNIFGSTPASTAPTTSIFGAAPATSTAPTTSIFGGAPATTTSIFGGASASTAPTTSVFGSAPATSTAPTTSIFGGAPATSSTPSPFGSSFGATSSAPTTSVFGGGGFGATSAAPSSASPAFGSGPVFGGTFSGFGTQPAASTTTSSFKFGGFGGQPADASKPTGFSSFGSPTSTAQPASPFGSSPFGAASPGQTSAFGGTTSTFGSSTTQPTSSSFTSYRK